MQLYVKYFLYIHKVMRQAVETNAYAMQDWCLRISMYWQVQQVNTRFEGLQSLLHDGVKVRASSIVPDTSFQYYPHLTGN